MGLNPHRNQHKSIGPFPRKLLVESQTERSEGKTETKGGGTGHLHPRHRSPETRLQIRRPVASSPRDHPSQPTALISSAISVHLRLHRQEVNRCRSFSPLPFLPHPLPRALRVPISSHGRHHGGQGSGMSEAEGAPETGGGSYGGKEQDRYLPIANIGRIMRRAVPENGKIAKDAKESVQECVSEFISFITSEASDKCMKEKRKTINGDDLIWSMGTLGFEEYVEPLKHYLKLYRETEGDTKGSKSSDHTGKKEILLNGEPGSSFDGV
ncbi:hypothetical protein PAHAL_3G173000 [Panicum hallii]|uniref:Transcription factor CBF/NF-Y/archaeal histone domain-containing protein n=2 Tax=Panicum hallii TaxID=206008 RepID=A0A2T8KIK1_9POAL|nr:hypothetical protein PAHAL_3G173000 [Panicum hallii]